MITPATPAATSTSRITIHGRIPDRFASLPMPSRVEMRSVCGIADAARWRGATAACIGMFPDCPGWMYGAAARGAPAIASRGATDAARMPSPGGIGMSGDGIERGFVG